MRKLLVPLILLVCSNNISASNIGDQLSREKVTQLDMVANSLNLLVLLSKTTQSEAISSSAEDSFLKFSVRDSRLQVIAIERENFLLITKQHCNLVLDKVKSELDTLAKSIPLLLAREIQPYDAEQLLNSAQVKVVLQAKENNELMIQCH